MAGVITRERACTALGSATPLSSTTTWSSAAPPVVGSVRRSKASIVGARFSASGPQQTHPFCSSVRATPSRLERRSTAAS
eukprot:scaffold54985_cov33-Phaeocystis_antarctica.AAC.1